MIEELIRPHVRALVPYSTARDEYSGAAELFLDANESPFDNGENRYPDPLQRRLKSALSELHGLPSERIFIGNGSDEGIELLIRTFCEPGRDSVLVMPPTYGMYRVAARANGVRVVEAPLRPGFEINRESVLETARREHARVLFVCSPNNPTGNVSAREDVLDVLRSFEGIVAVDEAYIDFSEHPGFIDCLAEFENLAILRTFSKAWGLAALRVGSVFARECVVSALSKLKPPYNVSRFSQETVVHALGESESVRARIEMVKRERNALATRLRTIGFVETVFASESNFLLVRVDDGPLRYRQLLQNGIVVRDRSSEFGCANCLRITIGTPEENCRLIETLEVLRP